MYKAEIAIIGGTGVYEPGVLQNTREVDLETPFGKPSDTFLIGEMRGRRVVFLNRHGKNHTIPPHKVNSRANIWALKEMGVKRIFSPSAVGSLKDNFRPGDIVIPDQFIDFTKKREYTFYDKDKVFHVSAADPFCPELRKHLIETGKKIGVPFHKKGTYICIEGPRFSTRAESRMFRDFGDIIGMTLVPECILAREVEICFVPIATITDYDVWAEKPVSSEEVLTIMRENVHKVKKFLEEVISKIPEQRSCGCKDALREAGV